jgi:hypothetical protein
MKLTIELSDNIRDKAIRKELGEQYKYVLHMIEKVSLCETDEDEQLADLQLEKDALVRVLNNYVVGGNFMTYFESGLFDEEFKDAEEA